MSIMKSSEPEVEPRGGAGRRRRGRRCRAAGASGTGWTAGRLRRAVRERPVGGSVTRSSSSTRGLAGENVAQAAFPQRLHAPCSRRHGHLIGGGTQADQALELGIHRQHLHDAEASTIPGHGALGATDRLEELAARGNERRRALGDRLGGRNATDGTDPPHEALSHDTTECRGDLVRLHAHVYQAGDGIGRIVGVQRARAPGDPSATPARAICAVS